MSEFTQALAKFSDWIENSESTHARYIRNHPLREQYGFKDWYPQPGLERELIELYAEEMNFKLPEEVYELYQWHNGKFEIGDYANPVYFGTFEEGFDLVFKHGFSAFPIFFGDGCYYAISEATDNLISSPIRLYENYVREANIIESTYAPNLTNLMKAVAECAENFDVISIYLMDRESKNQLGDRAFLISNIYNKYGVVGEQCGLWR